MATYLNFEPQLAVELDIEDLVYYMQDDNWWMEQKLDGRRAIVSTLTGAIYNRKGAIVDVMAWKDFEALDYRFSDYLDGEMMEDQYWVFDCSGASRFQYRRAILEENLPPEYVVPCARTTSEKMAMFMYATENNYEGIILKDKRAFYGQKNALRKVKFKSTVDCVVFELNRKGKSAVGLALWDGDTFVDVGACSTHGKKFSLDIGDVVEVQYLYATDSNRLYQPVLIRKRDDKEPQECVISQLKHTNKVVMH